MAIATHMENNMPTLITNQIGISKYVFFGARFEVGLLLQHPLRAARIMRSMRAEHCTQACVYDHIQT
jgi:hypothetical protein